MTARRQVEIVVPGSPDEVWDAIATSEGHAAWLFPADIDETTVRVHREPFAPDVTAKVTAHERPHRFGYEEPLGPGQPPLAAEFLIEARDGGSCVVRVVTGFADDTGEWEDLLDGAAEGWRMALIVLRAYLTHFPRRRSARVHATHATGRPAADRPVVAQQLLNDLGVRGVSAGESFRTSGGAPPLSGVVEHTEDAFVLLRTDDALYAVSAFPMAEPSVSVNVVGNLFGLFGAEPTHDAEPTAATTERQWRDWLRAVTIRPAN